jgi:hypothetical protein
MMVTPPRPLRSETVVTVAPVGLSAQFEYAFLTPRVGVLSLGITSQRANPFGNWDPWIGPGPGREPGGATCKKRFRSTTVPDSLDVEAAIDGATTTAAGLDLIGGLGTQGVMRVLR